MKKLGDEINVNSKFVQALIDRVNELDRLLHEANNREWVGLTEEEVDAIRKEIFKKFQKAILVTRDVTTENNYSAFNFYRAIEEKLRSKNDI